MQHTVRARRLFAWLTLALVPKLVGCGSDGSTGSAGDAGSDEGAAGDSGNADTSSGDASSADGAMDAPSRYDGARPRVCVDPSECPPTNDACVTPACPGVCGRENVSAGTPLPTDVGGDCKDNVCDGSGGKTTRTNDSDVAISNNACVAFACIAGAASVSAVVGGTACTVGGVTGQCDGTGHCVACRPPGLMCAAAGTSCVSGKCVPLHCTNAVKDMGETDVDCGGLGCLPCAVAKSCAVPADCADKVCTANVCVAASCSDSVANGSESDVDCGGTTCPACGPGKACGAPTHCRGGVCNGGTCSADCAARVKNGTESDIDCGGALCPGCVATKGCALDADCASKSCVMGHCG